MSAHPLAGGVLPADPDEGLIFRVSFYAAYAVACSYCKAPRGSDCFAKGKYTYALTFHKARVRAVDSWSDREKYDAFAAVRAEQVAIRETVQAELAKPLTPAEQATKQAISAVFAEADTAFAAREAEMKARCYQPWLHNEACHCRQGRPHVALAPTAHVVRDVTDLAAVRARKAGVR